MSEASRPRVVLVLLAATILAACTGGGTSASTVARPSPTLAVPPTPAAAAGTSAASSCVARTLTAMSDDQRIGQLFLLGLAGDRLGADELRLIRDDHVGSVWFTETSNAGQAAILAVSAAVQAERSAAATANVGFLVAANQEGGLIQALRGPGFLEIPSALDQGGIAPPLLETRAATWAANLRVAGVNLDFAPVADVVPPGYDAQNQPIGVLRREFGHDASTVGTHAEAFIRGLHHGGVAATLKHFPGLGRVTGNTDFSPAVDSVTVAPDASFKAGLDAGADFVMVALATYKLIDPARLAAFAPGIVTGMLRDSLGFRGVIVSDDLGATAAVATIPYGDRALGFLDAGGDMIISKTAAAATAMVAAVKARSRTDTVFRDRLETSVARVLAAKEARGLLSC